jgi:hypothetical protein
VESIITGAVFAGVFGALLLVRGDWWWGFPLAFAGVLPMVDGIRRLATRKRDAAADSHARDSDSEKQLLRAAMAKNGRLTATVAALETSLSLKEAEELLTRMAKEGHVQMRVLDSGVIEYEFPEFLPTAEPPRPI